MKTKKYEAFLTDDYYYFNKEEGGYDWFSDKEENKGFAVQTKKLGFFKTLEEAKQAIYDNAQLQDLYPSCFVYTKKDGEVYSSIPAVTKCECCEKEEWERVENNM